MMLVKYGVYNLFTGVKRMFSYKTPFFLLNLFALCLEIAAIDD